jgi:isopenicillin N synthase-like dioxygenase
LVLNPGLSAGFADHKESIQVAYDQRQWGSHWPVDNNCPGFRDEALTFMGDCESVVHKLLECFAIGLGMPYEDFKKVTCTCVFAHCS